MEQRSNRKERVREFAHTEVPSGVGSARWKWLQSKFSTFYCLNTPAWPTRNVCFPTGHGLHPHTILVFHWSWLMLHSQIWIREIDIFIPVRKTFIMSITHIYNIGIPKHKNTYDFLVQVRNFLLPLSLKVFRHKERDTIFVCWLFHLASPNTCDTCRKATGLASASERKSTFFFRARNSTDWLFSKSPKSSAHASGAWRNSHPLVTFI